MRKVLVAILAASSALTALAACSSEHVPQGQSESETVQTRNLDWQSITPDDIERAGLLPPGGYGIAAEQFEALQIETAIRLASGAPGVPGPAGAAGPAGVRATVVVSDSFLPRPTRTPVPSLPPGVRLPGTPASTATPAPRPGGSASPDGSLDQAVAQQAVQQRIIVRNVSMSAEFERVAEAIETIGRLAAATGGWVVSSSMPTEYQGFISLRVPADRLDASLAEIRRIASKVESETSNSQDFTEEFTDQSARLKTLMDTQDTLRALFARAEKIEDAIRVQEEITRIQIEVERIEGRLSFLQQSAAFSFISVDLQSVPAPVTVNAGPDITAAREAPVQFMVEFEAPEGFEAFTVEWDFGDGTSPVFTSRIAPKPGRGRASSPVPHVYSDEKQSPYIVTATVRGTGEAGVAEGSDTVIVAVTELPVIASDAGPDRTMATGAVEQFRVEFVPLEEIEDYVFEWDFGDGSGPVFTNRSAPTADGKRISAPVNHSYGSDADSPYIVTVKVRGSGDAGVAEGEDTIVATVTRIPVIEVFAGQNMRVVEGDRVGFEGSFTRPEGLTNLRYSWDFGDGSAKTEGALSGSASAVSAEHTYQNDRPAPFLVTLTVTGESPAGEAEAKSSIAVYVRAQQDWTVDGMDPGDAGRSAVRSLSVIGNGLLVAGIWLAIFSPFWVIGGALLIVSVRRRKRAKNAA